MSLPQPNYFRDYGTSWETHRSAVTGSDSDNPTSGSALWADCRYQNYLTVGIGSTGAVAYSSELWLKSGEAVYKAVGFDLTTQTKPATFRVHLDRDYDEFLVWLPSVSGSVTVRARVS
jgi:hypothetical protein